MNQVIACSAVRSAKPAKNIYLRGYLSPDGREITDKPILQSEHQGDALTYLILTDDNESSHCLFCCP
jgi:hypothetical protein